MPVYRVQGPDGTIYRVEGPDGASEGQVVGFLQQQLASRSRQAGFWKSFGEGATTLGALPEAAKFGLTDTPEARQALIADQTSENAKTSWADVKDVPSFVNWARQTAGTSMGYLAAPGAAGAIAQGLSKTPGVGKAVGLGMLGAQYLTENLGRQAGEQQVAEEQGQSVKPVSIGRAALAAAGQTGLDVVGFKFFEPAFKALPFVGKLFGKEGAEAAKEAGDQLAEAIAKQSMKYGENIAMGVARGVAFEVPQEVAQQAMERWQAGLPLNNEDARREYGEAMAGAMLLGGGLGAVQGYVETANTREEGDNAVKRIELQKEQEVRAAQTAARPQRPVRPPSTTPPSTGGTTLVPPRAEVKAAQAAQQAEVELRRQEQAASGAVSVEPTLLLDSNAPGKISEEIPDSVSVLPEAKPKKGKRTKKDATNVTQPPTGLPAQVDAAAVGAGVGVPAQATGTNTVQATNTQPVGLDNTGRDIGGVAEGTSASDVALRGQPVVVNSGNPGTGQLIGPEIPLTDLDRLKLEAAQNAAIVWPDQRFPIPKKNVEPTEVARAVLDDITSLKARIPDTGKTLLARNRLNVIEQKIRNGQELNDRDTIDLQKFSERFPEGAEVTLDRGTPREDLIPLLDAPERTEGESRSKIPDIDENGVPRLDTDGQPIMRDRPGKWEMILEQLERSDNPIVKPLARMIRETVVDSRDKSEVELLPQDVARRTLLNTKAEEERFKEQGIPYSDPALSKKHFNVAGGKSADRTRGIASFRPKIVLEGSDTHGNPEVIARLKKEGKVAEYDPSTNTIAFTREGVTDKDVLHEVLHAYTFKVLRQYKKDKSKLTPEQRFGAAQINMIMTLARSTPMAEKFPRAFDSVYEFVTYAMTEPQMQADLKRMKVPPVYTKWVNRNTERSKLRFSTLAKNFWNAFTQAIADTIGLKPAKANEEFVGNAMLELSEAVGNVMTIPSIVKGRDVKPLASHGTATVIPAPALKTKDFDDTVNDALLALKETRQPYTVKDAVKFFLGSTPGYERLVKDLQNDRRPLKLLQDTLQMAGNLIIGKNNIYDALTLSTQVAHWAMTNHLMEPMDRINSGVVDYARARGVSAEQALAELDTFFVAEHEAERRREKFLRFVPLDNFDKFTIPALDGEARTAYGHRKHIYSKLLTDATKPKTEAEQAAHEARIRQLKQITEELVSQYRDIEGKSDFVVLNADQKADRRSLEMDANLYDVIDMDPQQLASIRDTYAKTREQHGMLINEIKDAMQDMAEQTIKLNKEAHYWTQPVDNFQLFYGWEHYVPFKGKPGFSEDKADAVFERHTKRTGGGYEYVEAQEGFMGRKSKANNVILQTMVDGAKSALRYGRKDVAPALKSLIDSKYINGESEDRRKKGSKSRVIKFEDRYNAADTGAELIADENSVFLYKENGEIEVLKIDPSDKRYREAIRRSYRDPAPIMNFMNSVTGAMGHMHTRYNPSFAPYNFVRDALTNAFKMGAEYEPKLALQYLHDIAIRTMTGMGVARKISWMYHNGRIAEIEDMARDTSTRQGRYARDLLEYLRTGGRVAYIMGIAHKGQLNELINDVNDSDFKKRWQAVNKYIDVWADTFEFTSRASAYAVFKQHYMSEAGGKLNDTQATQKAAADAKNLANFEQVGTYGRQAGALFMFFRPAATGAVAALDSISQIWTSEQALLERLPNVLAQENAPGDPRGKMLAKHREMKKNAYLMLGSIAGAGAMIYTMALLAASDDDDLDEMGRNKVWKDDPSMWTRNIRLPMSLLNNESKTVIQIPWGFGLGAVGAMGAQVAATAAGAQGISGMLGNAINIGLDSFVPIPVSRIDPLNNTPAWIIDSLTPSMLRPLVEFTMNTDGLGREIYNNRVTKYGDAALGRANVPEGYHKAARLLRDITNGEVNVQPGSMYFWANNYLDGVSRIVQSTYGLGLVAAGDKKFDVKSDIVLLSSFVGRESNYDARKFVEVQKKIEKKQAILNQFKNNPAQYKRYLERDPYAEAAVYTFNKINNSYLRDIRSAINQVKASNDLTPKQRKEIVDYLTEEQNKVKYLTMQRLAQYGVRP